MEQRSKKWEDINAESGVSDREEAKRRKRERDWEYKAK